jgi:hypothetical protein
MPALPILGAHVYRLYVRAHYIADNRPLYTTLYVSVNDRFATIGELDIVVGVLQLWVVQYYVASCSSDISFDPIQVRSVHKPLDVLYQGGEYRRPIGRGGAPAPRAMSVNMMIAPLDAYGRAQRNRQQQFGVPRSEIAFIGTAEYSSLFVAKRILWLTRFRDDPDKGELAMAVYSPQTDLAYQAHTIYEVGISGTRETRLTGHSKK